MEKLSPTSLLTALLVGFAGGLGALLVERLVYPAPSLSRVDLTTLVTEQVTRHDVATASEAERTRHAARFAVRLEAEVSRLAEDFDTVVLAAPAVVAGAPDLTPVLRARLQRSSGEGTGNR